MTDCFATPVDSDDDDSSESLCRALIRANGLQLATDEEMDAEMQRIFHKAVASSTESPGMGAPLSRPPTPPPMLKPVQLHSPPIRPLSPPTRPLMVHSSPLYSPWPPLPPVVFQVARSLTIHQTGESKTTFDTVQPPPQQSTVNEHAKLCAVCDGLLLVSSLRNHWWSDKHKTNICKSSLPQRFCLVNCHKVRAHERVWVTRDQHLAALVQARFLVGASIQRVCRACGGCTL